MMTIGNYRRIKKKLVGIIFYKESSQNIGEYSNGINKKKWK